MPTKINPFRTFSSCQDMMHKAEASYTEVTERRTTDGTRVFKQTIPEGLEIKKSPLKGYGLYSTRHYKAGDVLYVAPQLVIPNEYSHFKLVTDCGEFDLNTETHSVQFNDSQRWLYLFDSFVNHSCDPNTTHQNHAFDSFFEQSAPQMVDNAYSTLAIKDIAPGDEITCDYNLFEYDAVGKEIETCHCGAADCVGRVAGFRWLTEAQMKKRYALCDYTVLEQMSLDESNNFLYVRDLQCPTDDVLINGMDGDRRLIAARDFKVGEIVYSNTARVVNEDRRIVIEVPGARVWLEMQHTTNYGNGKRLYYGFDSFQNHHCDPNTVMPMNPMDDTQYDVVAARPIAKGEELFVDYSTFDNLYLDGMEWRCDCGSENCKGIIRS